MSLPTRPNRNSRCARPRPRGAALVVLQELHSGLYFCQTEATCQFDLAEPLDGPTRRRFEALAKELDIVLVISIFEKRATGLYHNTALVMDAGNGCAGFYRKMHIPDDPGFYEKFYFTPGDAGGEFNGFRPIQTRVGKLGVLVCWDQWYPEAARLMALAGADMLIYPTAIGWNPADEAAEKQRQLGAWQIVQRGHAVANGLPVIVPNRTGTELSPDGEKIEFWGHSFVAGPQGEIPGAGAGRRTRRRCWWRWTSHAARRCAASGPSCATAGSTATRTSPGGLSTDSIDRLD